MSIHIQTFSNHQTYLEEFQWTKWILYMSVLFSGLYHLISQQDHGGILFGLISSQFILYPKKHGGSMVFYTMSYNPFFTCHKNYTLCSGDDHVDYDAKLAWNPWPALAWNLPRWGWRFKWGIVSFCSWWTLMGVIYSTCFLFFHISKSCLFWSGDKEASFEDF